MSRERHGLPTLTLSFSGSLDTKELDISSDKTTEAIKTLKDAAASINEEIADTLREQLQVAPAVQIKFEEGSIEWFGLITFSGLGKLLEVLSTISGVISLVQMVHDAIDRVLRKWFQKTLKKKPASLNTRVVVTSMPRSPNRIEIPALLFATAALIASCSMLIGALALWVRVTGVTQTLSDQLLPFVILPVVAILSIVLVHFFSKDTK